MPPDPYLHDRSDFADLIRIMAGERRLLPALSEKDYWIMHCLYGLGVHVRCWPPDATLGSTGS